MISSPQYLNCLVQAMNPKFCREDRLVIRQALLGNQQLTLLHFIYHQSPIHHLQKHLSGEISYSLIAAAKRMQSENS